MAQREQSCPSTNLAVFSTRRAVYDGAMKSAGSLAASGRRQTRAVLACTIALTLSLLGVPARRASALLLPDGTVVWNFEAVPHDGTILGEPLSPQSSPGNLIAGSLRFPPTALHPGYLAATLTLEIPTFGTVTSTSFFGLQPNLINFDFTGRLGDQQYGQYQADVDLFLDGNFSFDGTVYPPPVDPPSLSQLSAAVLQLQYFECIEFCYTGNPADGLGGFVFWNYTITALPEPPTAALVALVAVMIGLHEIVLRRYRRVLMHH